MIHHCIDDDDDGDNWSLMNTIKMMMTWQRGDIMVAELYDDDVDTNNDDDDNVGNNNDDDDDGEGDDTEESWERVHMTVVDHMESESGVRATVDLIFKIIFHKDVNIDNDDQN